MGGKSALLKTGRVPRVLMLHRRSHIQRRQLRHVGRQPTVSISKHPVISRAKQRARFTVRNITVNNANTGASLQYASV